MIPNHTGHTLEVQFSELEGDAHQCIDVAMFRVPMTLKSFENVYFLGAE